MQKKCNFFWSIQKKAVLLQQIYQVYYVKNLTFIDANKYR